MITEDDVDQTIEAIEAYDRMIAARRIRIRPDEMSAESLEDYQKGRSLIIEAISNGQLTVSEDGKTCTYIEQETNRPITFYKFNGMVLSSMDRGKDSDKITKLFLALATLTKQSASVFQNMDASDFAVVSALFVLFSNRL